MDKRTKGKWKKNTKSGQGEDYVFSWTHWSYKTYIDGAGTYSFFPSICPRFWTDQFKIIKFKIQIA